MKTIFILRHAEKPEPGEQGVDLHGNEDPESLTVRGWQRAGALVTLFGTQARLPAPSAIYASRPSKHDQLPDGKVGSKSSRPAETVSVLAAKLEPALVVDLTFEKGQEAALAARLVARDGVTLVCWQHENIPAIAAAIVPQSTASPTSWPPGRFDVVWTFTQATPKSPWTFSQIAQELLPGDRPA